MPKAVELKPEDLLKEMDGALWRKVQVKPEDFLKKEGSDGVWLRIPKEKYDTGHCVLSEGLTKGWWFVTHLEKDSSIILDLSPTCEQKGTIFVEQDAVKKLRDERDEARELVHLTSLSTDASGLWGMRMRCEDAVRKWETESEQWGIDYE